MNDFKYQLEMYRGRGSRYICPQCGRKYTFTRYVDTYNNNEMIIIATTHCWNTQQACMAQWLGPNFDEKIIYNDFRDNKFCSVIYNFNLFFYNWHSFCKIIVFTNLSC